MLTFHFVGRTLMYSRNSRSNHEPCPSRIKNGLSPEFSRLKTCLLSKHFNISVRRWPVTEPLSEWQQKQGMCFPLKKQPGPKGYTFPPPQLSMTLSGSPIHSAKGSTPVLHSSLNTLPAKIIAHLTGSPLAAVNPMTVKCASLVATLSYGRPVREQR
jgi:hypothetical protein